MRVPPIGPALVLLLSVAACTAPARQAATWVAAPSAGASASAPPAHPATGPRTITILGAGDELLHPAIWAQGRRDARALGETGMDFDPIFASVAPAIRAADLAVCHLETPLAPPGGPFRGYPRFSVPPQIARTIHDIGYDTCSTASNHTLDQGVAGIRRTLDALDAAGVHHAGSYRTAADQAAPNILEVTPRGGGSAVKVAQLSYTFGFNGLTRPAGEPWVANLIDPAAILAAAHRAKRAGAQIVVVSLHWGIEYSHTPTAQQKALAAQLLASPDVDLILGCHEHVVQPVARIGDKWVVYGMGNQLARHDQPIDDNREGIMPEFTFTEVGPGHWKVTRAVVIPTWVALAPDIRVIDLAAAVADPATPAADVRIYQGAVGRITGYVDAMGAAGAGLAVGTGLPTAG